MHIALAQLNQRVGDLTANAAGILAAVRGAERAGASLVVTPELSLCGYPPEDLLLRPAFTQACERELVALACALKGSVALVGFPERAGGLCYNAMAVIRDGRVAQVYRKHRLPNYTVFDEERYFIPGDAPCVFEVDGTRFGCIVCEDVWHPEPAREARVAGAQVLIVPNGSPFHTAQQALRREIVGSRARDNALSIVYVNRVGGQDELVFDGASFVCDASGEVVQQVPAWRETVALARFDGDVPRPVRGELDARIEPHVYEGLCMGVHDYVANNGFPDVVIGLSGGIDSALTLALAVDALGASRVRAVMMPSEYTAPMSIEDARTMADIHGVAYEEIDIAPLFAAVRTHLASHLPGNDAGSTQQNLQARLRGMILMALSNHSGALVLTTGNKSEMAVGYATLYGDMAGGFAPLKDVRKGLVYRLAEYRNSLGRVIPERVIVRAPSAELADHQRDDDTLPPYPALDAIAEAYIEHNRSAHEIVAMGHAAEVVARVVHLVRASEHKRRQAPPGVRVTPRAFGKDWRYPITSAWKD
ncbi:MAG TPA: NAD+ synthase [Casimicrobiaceae bacterium]|nr:NAD+ synthase [Casimicrobiaceae bacterium]